MNSLIKATAIQIVVILALSFTLAAQSIDFQIRQPLKPQSENSLYQARLAKKVFESLVIADMEKPEGWSVRGIGQMKFIHDRWIDGCTSLRFSTLKVDTTLVLREAREQGSYSGLGGGSTSAVLTFGVPQDWTQYNRIALWVYVHPSHQGYHTFYIGFNTTEKPATPLTPLYISAVQTMKPGQWNYVIWEIANLSRKDVTEFYVYQRLRGSDPEVENIITYDVDHVELQRVEADKYEGWDVAPEKIAFSHAGYMPEQPKTAVASSIVANEFQVVDAQSGKTVLSKPVTIENSKRGRFGVLDFSEVKNPGRYLLKAGEVKSRSFVIADTVWRQPVYKAINFYYCERCGFEVSGIHHVCHRDWQGIHNGEKKIINGGWHDAGDLSQGSFRTGMAVYAMLKLVRQLEMRKTDVALKDRILEEAQWGLDWLLKTRFGGGFRMTWSSMRIYTDCKVGTVDDVIAPAQNTPWENFLGSAVESFAYQVMQNLKPSLARQCLKVAEEDWEEAAKLQNQWLEKEDSDHALSAMISGTYLTSSWGVISSIRLFEITGNQKYADKAVEYGKFLLRCQEQQFVSGIPITGYFYNGPQKKTILHHSHTAFEESPLIALAELCAAFPDNEGWMDWYGALTLHSEYFLKRGAGYSAPFYMLPNSVYRKSEIMRESKPEILKDALKQFEEGIRFNDEYTLRKFPIWSTNGFHGSTTVQLSEALALETAALTRGDLAGQNLAEKQMQWVMGFNPFSQSLMYGEGYDFNNLYSPSSGSLVGALPVGMDCFNNDAPCWYDSDYPTYKEVWVVPASRFLWNAATIGMPALVKGKVIGEKLNAIVFLNRQMEKRISLTVSEDGNFSGLLPSGDYTIEYGNARRTTTLVSGGNYYLALNTEKYLCYIASATKRDANSVDIAVKAEGKGAHDFAVRIFNGSAPENNKHVNLESGNTAEINWNIQVSDPSKPWVVVIIPDGDQTWRKDLTGTM